MIFQNIVECGGLKILAQLGLNAASYQLALFLADSLRAGLEEVIASSRELSAFLSLSEAQLEDALQELQDEKIIYLLRQPGKPHILMLNPQTEQWGQAFNGRKQTNLTLLRNLTALTGGSVSNVEDLVAYREKNEGQDAQLRTLVSAEQERLLQASVCLSYAETQLMKSLSEHPQPRKQLLHALRTLEYYPHLQSFLQHLAKILGN